MKRYISTRAKVLKWLIVSMVVTCSQVRTLAQSEHVSDSAIALTVKTYDGLELPAQVLGSAKSGQKLIVFIGGSTPYDHKGNQWAGWDGKGNILSQKQDFYTRFLDIMSSKGYRIATVAKRSFVHSQKIPRPNFSDLALDVRSLILELKSRELLRTADDLVIVGYSEGSIVATKVLGLLKKQPAFCVLLGSASSAFNFKTQSWEEWYLADFLKRIKGWSNEQIQKEFEKFGAVMTELLSIDEATFENEWKEKDPYGFGFAPWESYYIDKEHIFYDPTANILFSNSPVLICIGENDSAMPMVLAKRTYDYLLKNGYQKATFRVIKDEVHQYKKYDVFAIICAWLDSSAETTEFVLDQQDKKYIAKRARLNETSDLIHSLSYEGGEQKKAIECFHRAKEDNLNEADLWFTLGIKLFANASRKEALYSFSQATDPNFIVHFASMVWIGHINDLFDNREVALEWYKKALEEFPGFPVQHDNWGIIIDKKWIEERLKTPFTGIK